MRPNRGHGQADPAVPLPNPKHHVAIPWGVGDYCPEGWAFFKYPGPGFEVISDNSAEGSYYIHVGGPTQHAGARLQGGFVALKNGEMILIRIPYPMGFYAKGLGREESAQA
jgi:hypothetical protein